MHSPPEAAYFDARADARTAANPRRRDLLHLRRASATSTREGEGLFSEDTRFLSRFKLTINGQRPLLLSSDKIEYFSAAFFMRNPLAGGLEQDVLSIRRERFVGDGMQDSFAVQNQGMEPIEFDLELEVGTDFADIFAVKDYDFALGDPLRAKPLPSLRPIEYDEERNQFLISDNGELPLKTQVIFSQRGEVNGSTVKFHLALEPRERWNLRRRDHSSAGRRAGRTRFAQRRFGEEVGRVRDSLAAWQLRVPQLRTSWDALGHSFGQSVSDLASLRMQSDGSGIGKLPGAGVPWFMTVFGRDTIITCLQTLALRSRAGAHRARGPRRAPGEGGRRRRSTPSPARSCTRCGTERLRAPGTSATTARVDATPLYLILLSEVWRWTDDASLVRDLKEPAMAALEWIDEYGDRDGDGFVEYERRTERGLENQSWKDSWDSQRFHDGTPR